jgi:hypothetical protein
MRVLKNKEAEIFDDKIGEEQLDRWGVEHIVGVVAE